MTAVGAGIFGALLAVVDAGQGSDGLVRLMAVALGGGLIVGWLEWQTLRLYRIPMGSLWCGVKPGMLLVLTGMMYALQSSVPVEGFWLLPLWGLLLDLPRWWLLRSHFSQASWWLVLCGLGWVVDTGILLFAGMSTIHLAGPMVVFFAVNGAINGAWMGLCRGGALAMMLRDRRPVSSNVPELTP